MLSARAASWLQVRPGEGRRVALTTAMMLIPGAGIAIGVSGAESLLLSRVGAESLPRLYIVLGLITIFTTLAITTLLGRISALRFYLIMPIAVSALLVGGRFLVPLGHDWIYEGLWMGASLFHTLLQVMLWGVAGMTWDTRQAKRLYPLFAAADIAGFSAGGLVTPVLVIWVGTANLLLIWVVTMLIAYGLALRLVAEAPETDTAKQPRARRVKRNVIGDLLSGFQYVLRSRLLFWIAVTAILFQGLVYLLWFLFSSAVEIQFPREDELTAFLGGFRGATTGIALLSSLLLATRINARFGLAASFVILAVFDVIGFSVLVVAGSFVAVVGLRFIHEVWQTGVARNAWQALFNVVPLVRREQTRLFINGVCLQVGAMLIGALLLLAKDAETTLGSYLVGVAAAVLALFAAWRVRQAYVGALLEALRAGRPLVFQSEAEPFAVFERDPAESAVALSRLSDPDVAVRRAASDILVDLADPEMVPRLVKGLEDTDSRVRANVLRALARLKASEAENDVITCLNDADPEVQAQAIMALRSLVSDPDILVRHLRPLLGGEEPAVRAESAATLLKLGPQPEALTALREMAGSDDTETRVEAMHGFANWADDSALEPVVAALDDPQPAVRRAAVTALAAIGVPDALDALLPVLGDGDWSVREAAAASIGTFAEDALDDVLEALADPKLETGAIRALTHLPVASKAQAIRESARERIDLALCYHDRWRSVLAWSQEYDSAQLLADALKQVAERQGINALQLLGTLANRDAFEAAIASLDSRDRGQSANAVEILDSVSDRLMVRPLLRLWEPEHESVRVDNTGSLFQSLRDPDPWVRACAALAARSVSAELAVLAREDPDDNVREVAANALKGDQSMENLKSLSMMERILFLKGVPLFAELAPPELKQVASITEERLFEDEELLAEQDEQGDELFIIVSGEVRVLVKSDDGMKELARRKSGEHVGEMAIISQAPRTARLVAAGPVRALCIGQKQFEVILRERPETSMAVMRELCERLRERAGEAKRSPAAG
jgi:HEAT repeat protein